MATETTKNDAKVADVFDQARRQFHASDDSEDETGSRIVGHKTMADGSHQPITQREAEAIMAQVEASDARRLALMPDEKSAIHMLFDAWQRLKDLGWREAQYCPKDGSSFEVIEAGSTGIFRAHYTGTWPDGSWWLEDSGDIYPSRPILHRLYPEDEERRKAKMELARERYQLALKEAGDGN